MTDLLTTRRFALPLLATAQAQKEVTHNEALTYIDALLHAAVVAWPQDAPPIDPEDGACWLVGVAPTGEWAEQGAALAMWSRGGWRFAFPRAGMRVVRLADGALMRFDRGSWIGPEVIPAPTGGVVVDAEARTAVTALLSALHAHGILKLS